MAILNKRLLDIKIPNFIARRQRTLEDHKHWKASECREWLIHFSVPVLDGILNPTPYVHFLLLVTSLALLTKYGMTHEDINLAEDLLNGFCRIYPSIYGRHSQTMNIHMLKHLAATVRRYGPLYSYSCFGFESMNSYIKKMVHGTRHINSQVCFAVGMSKQLPTLVRKFTADITHAKIKGLALRLGSKFLQEEKTQVPGSGIRSLGRLKKILRTNIYYDLLSPEMKVSSPNSFLRLQKGDTVFHCKDYQLAKTKNSYTVSFLDDDTTKFGFILCFVQVKERNYAVIEVCETDNFSLTDNVKESITDLALVGHLEKNLCAHIVRVRSHQMKVLVCVSNLVKICVLMEIEPNRVFISSPPNSVEHD